MTRPAKTRSAEISQANLGLAAFVDELIPEYALCLYKSETVLPRIAIAERELSSPGRLAVSS
jgi:hypothetical protein